MLKKLFVIFAMLYAAIAFAAVDVNKATAAELDAIKGIGPGISGKILDERKKGPFKDWNDMITRVNGIGDTNAAKFSAEGMTVGGASFNGVAAKPTAAAKKDDKPAAKDAKDAKPVATAAAAPAKDAKAAEAKPAADAKADPKAEAAMKKEADKKAKDEAKAKAAEEKKAKADADKKAKADAKPAKEAKPAAAKDAASAAKK